MSPGKIPIYSVAAGRTELREPVVKTDDEWMRILPPTTFRVTRLKDTEPAFTGSYYTTREDGIYKCACCGTDLFDSTNKFDSGSGWPSFTSAIARGNIRIATDRSHGMARSEVLCALCDAHLGHLFDDGPAPSRLRYCINSATLVLARRG